MSSETVTTASLIRPLLQQLQELSKPSSDDPPTIHQAKASLYHNLETRYNTNTNILDRCTFFDPRVKSLCYLSAEGKASVHSDVLSMMKVEVDSVSEGSAAVLNASTSNNANAKLLDNLLGSQYQGGHGQSNSAVSASELELNSYLNRDPCSMQMCPFVW